MKYAIVGFGTAGYHAVKTIRNYDKTGEIDVYSNTGEAPYNPMLTTYYVFGKLNHEGMYPFGSLSEIKEKLSFHLIEEAVIHVYAKEKEVETAAGRRVYDRILIATGARAFAPPMKGLKEENCFLMRTARDAERLKARMEQGDVKRAIVIGASMAGIKVAEVFHHEGIDTWLLDLAPYIFPLAAYEETAHGIEERVERKGVHLKFGVSIDHMEEDAKAEEKEAENRETCATKSRESDSKSASWGRRGSRQTAVLTDGTRLSVDLVVLCIGTRAATETVTDELQINRGILVNEHMETSAKGVYAAGDCAEGNNLQSHAPQLIGLWANANHQGMTAGANMTGHEAVFGGNILHNITHFMDMDFIGFGDNRIKGDVLEYGSPKGGLYLRMVFSDGKIAGANILDNYKISGIVKNYMLRLFAGEKERIPDYQRGMLHQAGLSAEIIDEIEDRIHE